MFIEKERQFSLFMCTDVLIYLGDCHELFSLVQRVSAEKSRFILSTEKQDEPGYSLSKSGRYTHSKNYIIGCAEKFGFKKDDAIVFKIGQVTKLSEILN